MARGFARLLLPPLAAAAALALLVSLGLWQLERARTKEALQARFDAHAVLPAVSLAELDVGAAANRYRRVVATGRFDTARQWLLDNQVRDGAAGYHVYAALRLGDGGAILVNRGWVPAGPTRRVPPILAPPAGEVRVHGRLSRPANPGLRLDGAGEGWPRVVQHLDYAAVGDVLGRPVLPAVILLDADQPGGYLRRWEAPSADFGPERHRGYAVQWFALALTLVVIIVALTLKRRGGERENSDEFR